jgi:hypothetical protein
MFSGKYNRCCIYFLGFHVSHWETNSEKIEIVKQQVLVAKRQG